MDRWWKISATKYRAVHGLIIILYAYEHAQQGDIFVQKAPASTIGDLAQALCEVFEVEQEIKIIGTRHGEKLYESLISREEMARAEDLGRYYRIPADNRNLNYNKYFFDGEQVITEMEDYTSHNTERLDVEGTKKLLLQLDFIQQALKEE